MYRARADMLPVKQIQLHISRKVMAKASDYPNGIRAYEGRVSKNMPAKSLAWQAMGG